MTLFRDIICAKVKGFCSKKVLIYVLTVSCIVTLVISALVVVYFTKWGNNPSANDSDDWNYKEQDKWPKLCKTSRIQSPIALSAKYAYKQDLPSINLDNFGEWAGFEVENNGHTIIIYPTQVCKCKKPKLSGGILTKNYTMDNIHFHWPSEHTIDGLYYDLEAHLVFYADQYGSFQEALKYPHGIAVIAILYLLVSSTASQNFRVIGDAAETVSTKPGYSAIATEPINLYEFLPYDHESFYAYVGSLTTPSCAEYVDWMVYKKHSNISYFDFQNMTTIYTKHSTMLEKNNRELQDLNGRKIYLHDSEP